MDELREIVFRTWNRVSSVLIALAVILLCGLGVGVSLLWALRNVSENQEATIKNQTAIASTTNQVLQETQVTVHQVSKEMLKLRALNTEQRVAIESQRGPLEQIIEIEKTLTKQRELTMAKIDQLLADTQVLEASVKESAVLAKQAANYANAAANQTAATNRTVREKVVTAPDKVAVEKAKSKLDAKTQAVDAKNKKLDTLVHQYKKAIKTTVRRGPGTSAGNIRAVMNDCGRGIAV